MDLKVSNLDSIRQTRVQFLLFVVIAATLRVHFNQLPGDVTPISIIENVTFLAMTKKMKREQAARNITQGNVKCTNSWLQSSLETLRKRLKKSDGNRTSQVFGSLDFVLILRTRGPSCASIQMELPRVQSWYKPNVTRGRMIRISSVTWRSDPSREGGLTSVGRSVS